jgi:hypothetical protein
MDDCTIEIGHMIYNFECVDKFEPSIFLTTCSDFCFILIVNLPWEGYVAMWTSLMLIYIRNCIKENLNSLM